MIRNLYRLSIVIFGRDIASLGLSLALRQAFVFVAGFFACGATPVDAFFMIAFAMITQLSVMRTMRKRSDEASRRRSRYHLSVRCC